MNTQYPHHDALARPLYVRRDVHNGEDILEWARAQGFASLVERATLHVTVAYSRQPLLWQRAHRAHDDGTPVHLFVPSDPARAVQSMSAGACALVFESPVLARRHHEIRAAGASWDWPDYRPHLTFARDAGTRDLSRVVPYSGPILLGPEVFAGI
ncbi:hypothetical protein [Pseudoxanthomonas sp. 10H]|uniref:hypothetical protein n=1 Tax=Pseudoxanthomonas sp. 10H TaxID=3242729 RepID=UPI003557B99C